MRDQVTLDAPRAALLRRGRSIAGRAGRGPHGRRRRRLRIGPLWSRRVPGFGVWRGRGGWRTEARRPTERRGRRGPEAALVRRRAKGGGRGRRGPEATLVRRWAKGGRRRRGPEATLVRRRPEGGRRRRRPEPARRRGRRTHRRRRRAEATRRSRRRPHRRGPVATGRAGGRAHRRGAVATRCARGPHRRGAETGGAGRSTKAAESRRGTESRRRRRGPKRARGWRWGAEPTLIRGPTEAGRGAEPTGIRRRAEPRRGRRHAEAGRRRRRSAERRRPERGRADRAVLIGGGRGRAATRTDHVHPSREVRTRAASVRRAQRVARAPPRGGPLVDPGSIPCRLGCGSRRSEHARATGSIARASHRRTRQPWAPASEGLVL